MDKKILILDDDEGIIEVITYILEDSGYQTQSLLSGETIFEAIATFKPDLVIMDVMLGNMDGRDICKKIKSTFEKPPIILISASHDLKSNLKQQGGPNDFIAKPFNIDYLLAKVAEHCQV